MDNNHSYCERHKSKLRRAWVKRLTRGFPSRKHHGKWSIRERKWSMRELKWYWLTLFYFIVKLANNEFSQSENSAWRGNFTENKSEKVLNMIVLFSNTAFLYIHAFNKNNSLRNAKTGFYSSVLNISGAIEVWENDIWSKSICPFVINNATSIGLYLIRCTV